MSATPATDVTAAVADVLELDGDAVGDHANLIECGLDSMAMMRLAARWRSEGFDVTFAELAAEPTIAAWRELRGELTPRRSARPGATAGTDDEGAPFELAVMQHAYWVGRNSVRELGGVAAHFYNEFDGTGIDAVRLESAVRAVANRHGMLRVRVHHDGTQQIEPEAAWPGLRVHDLRDLTADAARVELDQIRAELSHRILDVAAGEVFDLQLSLLPDALRPGGTRLHLSLDMIAADAVSLRILLADLADAYRGAPLTDIGYSYPSYLRARRAARAADPGRLREDRDYWLGRLPELPLAPALPAAAGGEVDATTVVRRHRVLSADEVRAFAARAREHGLTPAMALAATFAETLTAWSASPRFLVNLPLFDREPLHPDVASIVGDFTSSVLLAWDGTVAGTFAERARALQQRFHADAAHASYSGVEVLRELSRAHGERVLAPVVYTSAIGLGELFADQVREQFGDASWIVSQGPQVWLDAQVTEVDGGLLVNWDAREQAFAPGVLDAMFEAYLTLLESLITGDGPWDAPVAPMIPAVQRGVRDRVNATDVPRKPARLHDGFFARAAEQPDRPALLWGDHDAVSYGELAHRALAGAASLRRRAVRAGDLVAVSLPKGPDQVVAVLAVLAAGAVYVPIGVDQPPERVARIRRSSGVDHIVTEPVGADAAPLAAPVDGGAGDLAYVLHTSGSTGEPKGVAITHAAAMNTIDDLVERFAIDGDDRTIALSELEFDLSVFDIFAPLSVGGAVVCVREPERRDASAWVRLVARHAVTIVNAVPALVDMLLTAAGTDRLGLRAVLTGGDMVGADLPARLHAVSPRCRFAGLGGTTETAIHSTICEVESPPADWSSVPYGVPLGNVRCRVVDALGRDCPDWVPGELWIGGAGVAAGYRGNPALTAQRFTQHEGVRYYATGDIARYLPDGTLEFLGRADHQVKVRGHRIELGEIEAAFGAHPAVESAVACVYRDRSLGAVVTPAGDPGDADPEALRRFVAERLPGAMMPDAIAIVPAVPLTVNGKIDRPAVAALLAEHAAATVVALDPPRTSLERLVARVWSELLGVAEVGRNYDFFALGGDSLLATRLVSRLRAEGVGDVVLATLFAHPMLGDFAATLRPGVARQRTEIISDPSAAYEPFALTDVQRAYWLGRSAEFTLGGVGSHFYREYEAVDLDVARLEAAVDLLVQRHPMLRAVVAADGTQRVLPDVPRFRIDVVDVEDPAELARLRESASHRTFDPTAWPLFAIEAMRCRRPDEPGAGTVVRFGVGIDNIVLDALSILAFYTELGTLYDDPEAELPPIELTFRDYVLQTRSAPEAVAAAQRYWLDRIDTLPPAPALPLAVAPERITRPRFVRHETVLDAGTWRAVTERAREHRVTPSAVLLHAYAEVLSRWSAHPDLTLTVTLFDRRDDLHPHVTRVLGDFTSLALLAYRARPDRSWLGGVRSVQEELWQALDHREVSAPWVLRQVARARREPDLTMPVVFTSALGVPGGTAAPDRGPFARQVWGISQTPQVWLDHQVIEVDGGIQVNWDVVEELFPSGMVADMFAAYGRLLRGAAASDWSDPAPDLLPPAHAHVREAVNDTAAPPPDDGGQLCGAFFGIAEREPGRVAVTVPGGSDLTYGELAGRALRLAGLLTTRGLRPGDTAAVELPKGCDQVVAVLGVLAAGGAYVPIAVDQPPARAAAMRARAGTRDIVTADLLELAGDANPLAHPVPVAKDDLAYVIFTSGSTGEPKGVEVAHGAARNTVVDVGRRFDIGCDDRVLAVSALDFDLSVFDIFAPLSVGGTVVTIAEDARRDARAWVRLVREHRVTVWNTVPALMEMLLVAGQNAPGALRTLRVALASGDWVGVDLPAQLRAQAPDCRFVALGGATEASIWSNFFEVGQHDELDSSWRSVPYGRPLCNQQFRVVDAHGRDCPDWVTGELWIGGAGVALGYRGAPETTADKFVTLDGRRWYRTGDLGRYRPDGTLEFLGRADQQVKVRGHRIELGEVESALLACDGVGDAVSAVAGAGHAARLVAAVVPELPARGGAQATGTTPVTGTAPVPAEVAATRDRDREVERRVVVAALSAVLRLPELATAPTTVDGLGVDPFHGGLLELWLGWLERQGVVVRDGERLLPGTTPDRGEPTFDDTAYQRLLARAHRRLTSRVDDYRAILAGTREPSLLLDDPVLAPAALVDADPGSAWGLDEIASRIKALAARRGRAVRVVELGGRAGDTAVRLLGALAVRDVEYTVMDESPAMIAVARQRLERSPHEVSCEVSAGDRIAQSLVHSYDVVVANNVLHRFADPASGPLVASALLAPGGELLMIEREELTPIAMITAGLLEGGYGDLDPRRRAAGSPMLTAAQWAHEMAACGFEDVEHHTLGTSFAAFIRAVRPATAGTIDMTAVRAQLARQLPPHMIPDRLGIVPAPPLSPNGKVDRAAIAALLPVEVETVVDDPEDGLEHDIAQLWTELLGVPAVGRGHSFFELGGDSLLATRFIEAASVRLGVEISLRTLFAGPTLAEVAAAAQPAAGVEEGEL